MDIAVGADGGVVVHGELTIKGRTHPAARHAARSRRRSRTRSAASAAAWSSRPSIDRRLYGLEWNLPLPKGGLALDNDVKLIVNLEFTQA